MSKSGTFEPLDVTIVDLFDRWATKTPDRVAVEWHGDALTYGELRTASLHVSRALLSVGLKPGAKVPILTQMSLEMIPAVIGILRVGACYAPVDVALWSSARVEAALRELSPRVAVATAACPTVQLPLLTVNFQKEWLRSPILNGDCLHQQLDVIRHGLHVNSLAWIIFTSGSTGEPKGVMIYHRSIYEVTVLDHNANLEASAESGIRCLLAFSIAFDGCAAVVWTTLTKGGTLVMASPSDFPDVATRCDLLHLTPSMLAVLDPSGPYQSVRYIFLGAEAPQMDIVRKWISPTRKVFNTYGPSETTCIISLGELKIDEEAPFGDLLPGVRIALVDEDLQECDHGEIMIRGPGLAAGYLNNPDLTARKFIQWNGERWYRTGDLARRTGDGKYVWAGRVDSLVKNRGFLINLETEVEAAILSFPPVELAVAIKWRDKLVACVQPATVDADELRAFMQGKCDPFVVPDQFLPMDRFPRNINGKTDRHALGAQLDDRASRANGDFVTDCETQPPVYDALRRAFSMCLQVAFKDLDRNSSFVRLGGNSLSAVRLCNALKTEDYLLPVTQILKLDTIGFMEGSLTNLANAEAVDQRVSDLHGTIGEVRANDTQIQMLTSSLHNPALYTLIGTTRYIGHSCTIPSPKDLRDAYTRAVSAHSVFQTRFDLINFTLHDTDQRQLEWHDVEVDETNFEAACVAEEEKAWADLNDIKRSDIEIPFFHVACVSVKGGTSVALVTRVHHVLTDVFSSAIFVRDVERALAGGQIPEGPRFRDYARYMQKHKSEKLSEGQAFFENLLMNLPNTSVFHPPAPRAQHPPGAFSLACLEFPTNITRSSLDAAARTRGVFISTLVYAAWSLFLSVMMGRDRVGFSLSLSGRTISWPSAPDVVGALVNRLPFCTAVPTQSTVQDWLFDLQETYLSILEFDGLGHGLQSSVMQHPPTRSTCVLCLLDAPQPSRNWIYEGKQEHRYMMLWQVYQDKDDVKSKLDVNLRQVDREWAEKIGNVPGKMLHMLVCATQETLVADLLEKA